MNEREVVWDRIAEGREERKPEHLVGVKRKISGKTKRGVLAEHLNLGY